MYFARYRTAVFVHGCFWHRHEGCRYAYMPKSRVEFWQKKFETNIRRDEIVRDELAAKGIRRLIVWECTIRCMKKNKRKEKEMVDAILSFIKGIETAMEF